jgi:hypothetical protein
MFWKSYQIVPVSPTYIEKIFLPKNSAKKWRFFLEDQCFDNFMPKPQ